MKIFVAVSLALTLPCAAQAQGQGVPVFSDAEPELEFAFEATVTLGAAVAPGQTARGGRNIIPITGGSFAGPRIRGEVMPGGWDWQLQRADGCGDVVADYFLKTDDGAIINVVNKGAICPPQPGEPFLVRTQPVFEAPLGQHDWLSKSAFIGTLRTGSGPEGQPAVILRFYRVK